MRKLVVIEFLSLDGVMQAPGDPNEDTEGGFRHGGWQRPYFDEVLGHAASQGMATTGCYLFGRKTYEKFASYWQGRLAYTLSRATGSSSDVNQGVVVQQEGQDREPIREVPLNWDRTHTFNANVNFADPGVWTV